MINYFQRINLDRPTAFALDAWVLVMIAVPIQRWLFGDDILTFAITLGVLAQVIAVFLSLKRAWGFPRTALTCITVMALAWLVEFVGHKTGFPFGAYHYTERLQPQLGGVPLLIPFAWLMMLPASWAVAVTLQRGFAPNLGAIPRAVAFVVLSALAFTVWDLFLDPQMVSWNFWVWQPVDALKYLGIPLSNYAGWLLASGAITLAIFGLHRLVLRKHSSLLHLPLTPLLIIYVITWFLQTFGQLLFWDLPQSGIVGGIAMGLVIVLVGIALKRR